MTEQQPIQEENQESQEQTSEQAVETTKVEAIEDSETIEVSEEQEATEKVEQPEYKAPEVVNLGVQAPPKVSTVQATPAVVSNTVKTDNSDLAKVQKTVLEEGTRAQKSLIASLDRYLTKMKPGMPVNPDEGARNQYMLWRTIQGVIENSSTEEFKKLWYIVLTYFNNYKTEAFGERYVFRFSEYWVQSEEELKAFQRILNLIILTADSKTRTKSLSQVSIPRTLEEGFSELGRQRILSFYNQQ